MLGLLAPEHGINKPSQNTSKQQPTHDIPDRWGPQQFTCQVSNIYTPCKEYPVINVIRIMVLYYVSDRYTIDLPLHFLSS